MSLINYLILMITEVIHLLCDFHRGQNWVRWVNTSRNGCSHVKSTIIPAFKRIAEANTHEELDTAVEKLKQTRIWNSNKKLQSYFNDEWLDKKEVWKHTVFFRTTFSHYFTLS